MYTYRGVILHAVYVSRDVLILYYQMCTCVICDAYHATWRYLKLSHNVDINMSQYL